MKKYYFPDAEYVDSFFNAGEWVCTDYRDIERLRVQEGWENVWEQVHEASAAEIEEYGVYDSSAKISVDNGQSYCTPAEALEKIDLDTMTAYMDDDVREAVHNELAPCSDIEFLARYLELAEADLVIG